MKSQSNPFREKLLAEHEPDAGRLAYRKEVAAMLKRYEKRLRLEKIIIGTMWIFIVLLVTAFFTLSGLMIGDNAATIGWVSGAATMLFMAVALAAMLVNVRVAGNHLETLKELKKIEMEVLDLKEGMRKPADSRT